MKKQTTFKRNSIFTPLWSAQQRYIVMLGSAGSGKSMDSARFYILRILSQPGRNLLCIRKVAESNRTSTYNELRKAAFSMGLSRYFTFKSSPLEIHCVNGNVIMFGGVNDEGQREKLKSVTPAKGNLTDVWIEEATEITQADFEIIDDRLRGVLPPGLFYQIRLTFNPVSSAHWIKKTFFDIEDSNVLCHKSTYKDNAFCDRAYHERMERRKLTDPRGYKIYGLGEWGETEGLIFTNFICHSFPTDDHLFDYTRYGQDFGFNHANALLDVGFKDGEVYIKREIYLRGKTTDRIIKSCDFHKSVVMYCDSAEPDRILTWQKAGYNAVPVKKGPGSVKAGIDWLKSRKIHIHPSCTNTLKEISQWRWRQDRATGFTDEPVAFGDDAMAALRYACSEFITGDRLPYKAPPTPVYNFKSEIPTEQPGKERTIVI